MPRPRVCVLRAPGTNCDLETAHAFERAGATAERVHLSRVLENSHLLDNFEILCIPGGFSYGDDIGAGAIFSQKLAGPLAEAIARFLERDTLVLGICNGFQVLLKAGIVPQGTTNWPPTEPRTATLTWNENGKYTALWVRLKNLAPHNIFLKGIDEIELPIAHAEGRFIPQDADQLHALQSSGHIALCYVPRHESVPANPTQAMLAYPDNPNGSIGNIAALSDATGRVLGLMPHPERYVDATQHPQWTRQGLKDDGAGLTLFKNAVSYFSND